MASKDQRVLYEAIRSVLDQIKSSNEKMSFDIFIKRVEALSGRTVDKQTATRWLSVLTDSGWITKQQGKKK